MYCKMMYMNHEGLNASKIAAALAADVRTVRKWLLRKGFAPGTGSRRDSKLDPFKRDIGLLLEAHPYSAMQIYLGKSEKWCWILLAIRPAGIFR